MPKPPSLSALLGAGRGAVRVTVAATVGFYSALHLFARPVVAVYALFAAVAFGVLSPLAGSGRRRATTVLLALPAAAALIALGTALAVATWSAAAGMLLVAFALTFAAACAPRPATTVPALQLCYILACFPPYAPDTLPDRLLGLALGAGALALCELLLLPQPRQPSYGDRLADALDLAARAARRPARSGPADAGAAVRLRRAGQELRFSRQPAGSRPAGAGRSDRALTEAGSAARRLLDQLAALAELAPAPVDVPSRSLLHGIAASCADTAAALRGERPARPEAIEEMTDRFLTERAAAPDRRTGSADNTLYALLRHRSTVLTCAVGAVTVSTAVALAADRRRSAPGLPRGQFWYAGISTARLWYVRVSGNLTPRSVVFQNAVRTALGLALARLVAGSLDLTHGFWVLLSVLTLARTTAGATWSAVRSAALGTLLGAVAAGALFVGAGDSTRVYDYLLVPTMLVAFSVGPVGGPAWAQGLFTLVVSTAFAQLDPVTWRLAEARLVDVLTGSAIGLVCGLLAWPSGARAEIRRSVAALLRTAGPLVQATAESVTGAESVAGSGPLPGPQAVTGPEAGGSSEAAPGPRVPTAARAAPTGSRAAPGSPVAPASGAAARSRAVATGSGVAATGSQAVLPGPGAVTGPRTGDRSAPSRGVGVGVLWPTLHRLRIAEAAYAQYRAEPVPHEGDGADWLAALNFGSRLLIGAYWLPPPEGPPPFPAAVRHWSRAAADEIAAAGARAARSPADRPRIRLAPLPWPVTPAVPPAALALLVDMDVWLHALAADLDTTGGTHGGTDTEAQAPPERVRGGSPRSTASSPGR
ncbi:FUSC family protein [Streptomyces sp. NPDC088789]|uniref:FUSC family protein n=1 Tax=Streptomyces sp. NPDC088789 TaxID=3365899 RepID=UPI0037FEF7BB